MSEVLKVHLDFESGVAPGQERGERPLLHAKDVDCGDCGQVHDLEKCPKCGAWIEHGFGLMFGGFGPYKFCRNDACDWFWKRESEG